MARVQQNAQVMIRGQRTGRTCIHMIVQLQRKIAMEFMSLPSIWYREQDDKLYSLHIIRTLLDDFNWWSHARETKELLERAFRGNKIIHWFSHQLKFRMNLNWHSGRWVVVPNGLAQWWSTNAKYSGCDVQYKCTLAQKTMATVVWWWGGRWDCGDWVRVEQKEVGHGGDKKQIILYGGDKRTKTMNH